VTLKEEEDPLFIEKLIIVFDLALVDVFIELVELFTFVLVMLNLSEVEESGALLAIFCLLFFF
jgi:hypothetical protein